MRATAVVMQNCLTRHEIAAWQRSVQDGAADMQARQNIRQRLCNDQGHPVIADSHVLNNSKIYAAVKKVINSKEPSRPQGSMSTGLARNVELSAAQQGTAVISIASA